MTIKEHMTIGLSFCGMAVEDYLVHQEFCDATGCSCTDIPPPFLGIAGKDAMNDPELYALTAGMLLTRLIK